MFLNLIFLILSLTTIKNENNSLRFSFIIFRHGARSPYDDMSSDFKDLFNYEWEGKKELTSIGQRQHFQLGNRHRKRYMTDFNLIKKNYDPREIYVISTDTNRTIMSAQCQLQGLYLENGLELNDNQIKFSNPPNDEINYKEEKEKLKNYVLPNKIEIVPIHQFFVKDHTFQLEDQRYCPGLNKTYIENRERKEIKDFMDKFIREYGQKLINKMREKIEEKDLKKFYTYKKALDVFDTIISIYSDGRNMDIFGSEEEIKKLIDTSYEFLYYDFLGNNSDHNINIGLYSMSPTFEKLINWMDLKIKKDKEGDLNYLGYDLPKLVLYSAHDYTVGAFELFMYAVFNTSINFPYYASFANLELVRFGNGFNENDYVVNYYFDDKFIGGFNYEFFKNKVREKLKNSNEIAKFCLFDQGNNDKKNSTDDKGNNGGNNIIPIFIIVLLSILSLVLIVVNIIMWLRGKDERNFEISGALTEN